MQKQYLNHNINPQSGAYMLTVMKLTPKAGHNLEDAATEVCAESSTGSNLRVGTATEFSDELNAVVYDIKKEENLVWIAYPWRIFDRGGSVQSIMTFIAGNVYGMSELQGLKILDCWFPEEMLKHYDGPSTTIFDMKKYLGIGNRPVLGTIVKPKIGLKPQEFAEVVYRFWKGGGDFVKFDEPQADQDFCPFRETVDEIAKAMERVESETGKKKVMSINISSADFMIMKDRAEYIRSKMKQGSYAFLVDGITSGWTAVQTARRLWPDVFLHFHRAGHGAMTREESPFGYSVLFMTKHGRIAGASGMHTGTAGIGKMAGTVGEDIKAAHAALFPKSEGHYFEQNWGDMKPTCPISSGGMNPVLLRPFIEVIGTADFIITMGGGVHSHPGGTEKGATAMLQACEAWEAKIDLQAYAKDHPELADAVKFYGEKFEYTRKYLK